MAILRLAVCFLVWATTVGAVEIRFVPAMAEGTVSLGIYDVSGRLVRILCDEWPMNRFKVGLNGLSTEWDGMDSSGRTVPAGIYRARGYVIGNVGVEGEAFHFNDWITSADSPRIVSVGAVALLPGGDLLLAARLANDTGALLRYSPQASPPWQMLASEHVPEELGQVKMAVAAGRVFLLMDRKLRALDLATGGEISVPASGIEAVDISAHDERLAILQVDKLTVHSAADLAKQSEIPLPPIRAAGAALLDGKSAAVVGEDGSLWHGLEKWNRIETPEGTKTLFVAASRSGTFWTAEQKTGEPAIVVQYSPEEGRLAEWSSTASGSAPAALAASSDEDAFCAVFDSPSIQRTVAIRRGANSGWEFFADKTITASGAFGLADGKVSPLSGELPSELTIDLPENPLDSSTPRTLLVRAAAFDGGTGLVTAEGLPLVRVSGQPGFTRLMVVAGAEPGTAQFYQGDGACVEQYLLTNIGEIVGFDAGTMEMEGGTEKPAPPEEDVPDPTP